jgi:IS30 family transposase
MTVADAVAEGESVGRPPKELDEARVARLAEQGSSAREIADLLGCDHKTITSRFSPLIRRKRAERRLRFRNAQDHAALEERNIAMLIWIGKQELGQMEKVQHRGHRTSVNVTIRRTDAGPGSGGDAGHA